MGPIASMNRTLKGFWWSSERCSAVNDGWGLEVRQVAQVAHHLRTSCSMDGQWNIELIFANVSLALG